MFSAHFVPKCENCVHLDTKAFQQLVFVGILIPFPLHSFVVVENQLRFFDPLIVGIVKQPLELSHLSCVDVFTLSHLGKNNLFFAFCRLASSAS